jgi:hypothetical protein
MKLIPVDSSGVRAVGYEEERKILHIRFIDGDIYEYYGSQWARLSICYSQSP